MVRRFRARSLLLLHLLRFEPVSVAETRFCAADALDGLQFSTLSDAGSALHRCACGQWAVAEGVQP